MGNYYGMSTLGWYEFARSRGFTGTPEQLMDLMIGNFDRLLDHTQLTNRDADGQHPISAIAGLDAELARLQREIDAIKG
ncbi:MAG: hypothetical protein IKZ09_00575 [Clostridia bacterium]|nr:hypothetical protein [Clostridia bacterium]